MKTQILIKIAACFLAACCLLTACQGTPEREAVVNKGDGVLESALAAEPVELQTEEPLTETAPPAETAQETCPATWQETLEIGNVSIIFDVPVENRVLQYPVYRVAPGSFTCGDVNAIVHLLAPDAVTVRPTGTSTEEIHENLEAAIRGWWYDDGDGEGYYGPYEGQEEDIKKWQQKLTEAKDESVPYQDFAEMPVRKTISCASGKRVKVACRTGSISIAIDCPQLATVQGEEMVREGGAIRDEPKGTEIGPVSITEEQALAVAETAKEYPCFRDMQVCKVEKARLVNGNTAEVIGYGYEITYCRADGGYAPYVGYDLWSNPGEHINESSEFMDMWMPETASIYVDDHGIRTIGISDPYQVECVVNENVEVLPFAEIQELLRNRFRHEFTWDDMEATIRVTRIALVGAMVRVKDDPDHAYILPVWLCEYDFASPAYPETMHCALAVNAVDGTNVNPCWA